MSDKNTVNNTVILQRLKDLIDGEKSRETIAEKTGCNVSLITKHYNGQRIVTIDFLKKYAEYFEVSTDYLLGMTDAKTINKDIQFICDTLGLNEETIEFFIQSTDSVFSWERGLIDFIECIITEYDYDFLYAFENVQVDTADLIKLYSKIDSIINGKAKKKGLEIAKLEDETRELELKINGNKYAISHALNRVLDKFSVSKIDGVNFYELEILKDEFFKKRIEFTLNEHKRGENNE